MSHWIRPSLVAALVLAAGMATASDQGSATGSLARSSHAFSLDEVVESGSVPTTTGVAPGTAPLLCWILKGPTAAGTRRTFKLAARSPSASLLIHDGDYSRPGWRRCEQFGAGMTTGWGAHHVDTAHWGMGAEYGRPRLQPVSSAEIAHRSCSACLVTHAAMKLGRRRRWDVRRERLLNDDEANAQPSRPQRHPYGTSCTQEV